MKREEQPNSRPWIGPGQPSKILVIRLQAFGDTVITLPFVQRLRDQNPNAQIDLLVLEQNAMLPRGLVLYDSVFGLKGSRAKTQFIHVQRLLPHLLLQRYDVVIDLQRNRISRWVRFWAFPKSWSEIERFSFSLAGDKFKNGVEAAGFTDITMSTKFRFKGDQSIELLRRHGWDGKKTLVVLNPAGAFVSRHWPLENYIQFARLWLRETEPNTQFLFLGLEQMQQKATALSESLGSGYAINLVNKVNALEAFSILRHVRLVLSEDSGLMHMAWVQGVPTLALFGSSPSYWSAPMGAWSRCLSSSDLPCGNCFSETCRFGDVHCLTRHSPEYVLEQARQLVKITTA